MTIVLLSFISLVISSPSAFALSPPLIVNPVIQQENPNYVIEPEHKSVVNPDDKCPTPKGNDYSNTWSCGSWEYVDGELRRVFRLYVSEHTQVDVGAPNGELFKGWTFNGTIPGPTLRMTQGDPVTIYVYNPEESTRPHSFHKHSVHETIFDGAGLKKAVHFINPGQLGQYIFDAYPAGVYPYHCHIDPIADHINRGLYGMLIIDPPTPRPPANELIMLMNGYDFDYDAEGGVSIEMPSEREEGEEEEERDNEIYTVNGKAFQYMHDPIHIDLGEPQRIYLVNMLEFDLVNSFHLHGNMFSYSSSGTYLSDQNPVFTDILTLGQGDRGIIEWKPPYIGTYMFHAHVNEFTDLGWMGFFQVNPPKDSPPQVTPISYTR